MSSENSVSSSVNKNRQGKWSLEEKQLFEELLSRYGKNWKKIHSEIPGRTLTQVRSHGQKYFCKHGAQKQKEFQRKAKILQALQTFEKEDMYEELERMRKIRPEFGSNPSEEQKRNELMGKIVKTQKERIDDNSLQKESIKDKMKFEVQQIPKTEQLFYPFLYLSPETLQNLNYKLPQDMLSYTPIPHNTKHRTSTSTTFDEIKND